MLGVGAPSFYAFMYPVNALPCLILVGAVYKILLLMTVYAQAGKLGVCFIYAQVIRAKGVPVYHMIGARLRIPFIARAIIVIPVRTGAPGFGALICITSIRYI